MIRFSLWKLAVLGASILGISTAFVAVSPPSRLSSDTHHNNPALFLSSNGNNDNDVSTDTYKKAPPVTADLYDESIPTLYGKSQLAASI